MPAGPAPSPYDLHNRIRQTEAALRSTEKALASLFRKVNVNRKRDPELDVILDALAAILHGLKHARGDRSGELQDPARGGGVSIGLRLEDEMPAITPAGRSTRLRIVTTDSDGAERDAGTLELPEEV